MKYFPYKLWLYWFKCGAEFPVYSDPRRINKRFLSLRLKSLKSHSSNRINLTIKNILFNA